MLSTLSTVSFPTQKAPADLQPTLTARADGRGGYVFTLKVTNTGKKPRDFWFHSCDPYAVQRVSDSLTVFQRGGICTTEGPAQGTLKPGEAQERVLKWDGKNSIGRRVEPGQYRVKLALGPVVGETTFTVR